ncbi:MAG: class I SAM-dependent methyltransferase [Oceanospirillaceae bacterium]|jgi:SAM-dependent methyltransferase|uniref:class I SAM-dependent methyltransferase n=1 Tax=Marinobacterium litorale TaxID=404770 RepID=UPI000425C1F9|nr:class I SAM-dependent methyltransferase [Marinobacterium litorale]MBS99781.1 class I SAM-dependent methyltransferase [Oceanospirillaceae bacterium]
MTFQQLPQPGELNEQLKQWFDSPLGRELLDAEHRLLEQVLPELFGYHLLQVGVDSRYPMFTASPVPHRIMLGPSLELGMEKRSIIARSDELPVQSDSIDVVLLHHALDFSDNPHQVLREAARILRPGGHLVNLSFNPASLWGIYRRLTRRRHAPWSGHFIRHGRLQDWISLLEMTETRSLSALYAAPLENPKRRRRCSWLRVLARGAPAHSGAALLLVARKDVPGMTPLRQPWRRKLISLPVIEPKPTARHRHRVRYLRIFRER